MHILTVQLQLLRHLACKMWQLLLSISASLAEVFSVNFSNFVCFLLLYFCKNKLSFLWLQVGVYATSIYYHSVSV